MFPRGAAISERHVSPGAATRPGVRVHVLWVQCPVRVLREQKSGAQERLLALRPVRPSGDGSQVRILLPGLLSWTVAFQAPDSPNGSGHHDDTPAALGTLAHRWCVVS